MKLKILLSLFFVSMMVYCYSASTNGQIALIYGNDHVYSLFLPQKWDIDNLIAKKNNLGLFSYPKEYMNKQIPTYIHSTGYSKNNYKSKDINNYINDDINNFKKSNPTMLISKKKPIIISKDKKITLYEFIEKEDKSTISKFEYVAYIDSPTVFCNIIFSTNNAEDLNKYYSDFILIVKSFEFEGENIDQVKNKYKIKKEM